MISSFDERLKTFLHQGSQSAAEHRLLAEQIAFGFLFECRLENAGSGGSDSIRICQRQFVRAATRILMNCNQGRHATAFRIHAAHEMAGAFGRNHDYVHLWRWDDRFEMNAEAVRKTEHLSFGQTGLDGSLVKVSLRFIRRKNLKIVGALRSLCRSEHRKSISLRLLGAAAAEVEANDDVVAAVAEVLCLRVSLAAVAKHCDSFALEGGRISVVLVEDGGHDDVLLMYVCVPTGRSVSKILPFGVAPGQHVF